jgi:hypothetical protein
MRSIETNPIFEEPDIQAEIANHVEIMYSPEKLGSAYLNRMFGLNDGELSQEEIGQLALVFKQTGELLLRTNLEKNSFENLDEVKKAIQEHAEYYSKFGAHDLIHVVIEHDLENADKEQDQWKPAIPEFLQADLDNIQAMREEFPAVLWTPISDTQPIFLDMMAGNSENVLQTLRKNYKGKEVDKIDALLKTIDYFDFQSITNAYTEVLLYLTYKVAKRDSGLEGDELKQWKQQYKKDQEIVRESIQKQVREFIDKNEFSGNGKGDRTEQMFIEQAHSIFENYNQDKKISFKNFIKLSQPFIK